MSGPCSYIVTGPPFSSLHAVRCALHQVIQSQSASTSRQDQLEPLNFTPSQPSCGHHAHLLISCLVGLPCVLIATGRENTRRRGSSEGTYAAGGNARPRRLGAACPVQNGSCNRAQYGSHVSWATRSYSTSSCTDLMRILCRISCELRSRIGPLARMRCGPCAICI
jgi:hypothetical protein